MTPSTNPPSTETPPAPPAQGTPPAVDPEVARLRAEVASQRQSLDQMRQRFTAPPQPAVHAQPPDMAAMNKEFFKEPVQSSIAIAQRAASDAANAVFGSQRDTLIRLARQEVRSKDTETFDKYSLEIENAVSQAGPQFATNVNVWDNAFKMIKGSHIDEILAAKGQQTPPPAENRAPAVHISREGGPAAPSARPGQASKVAELSDREKYTAKRLGLTEDGYRAGKLSYEGQNDPVVNPVGKSTWDEHMTFSTKERKRQEREKRLAGAKK